MLARLARSAEGDAATLSLGRMIALVAVYADAAEAVVAALDSGKLARQAAALVGLRVLAAELLQLIRDHRDAHGHNDDSAIERTCTDLQTSLSVARGPRQARQARLGEELIAASRPS
jgi:hypothetical protein